MFRAVFIVVGGCLLLASFCVEGAQKYGTRLVAASDLSCAAWRVNLAIHARVEGPHSHRHFIVQMLLAALVAAAAFWLAGYLFRYGVLPKFLMERYH